eukprot:4099276-Heterocapsa_arctica.AAC.1
MGGLEPSSCPGLRRVSQPLCCAAGACAPPLEGIWKGVSLLCGASFCSAAAAAWRSTGSSLPVA